MPGTETRPGTCVRASGSVKAERVEPSVQAAQQDVRIFRGAEGGPHGVKCTDPGKRGLETIRHANDHTLSDLEHVFRRREVYLANILRRYREITPEISPPKTSDRFTRWMRKRSGCELGCRSLKGLRKILRHRLPDGRGSERVSII